MLPHVFMLPLRPTLLPKPLYLSLQALASPLSGLIGDKADRTKVVAAGCMLWGVMTSAIGLATTMPQVSAPFRPGDLC